MIRVSELRKWLEGLEDIDFVAIDDSGMELVEADKEEYYLEVGGVPKSDPAVIAAAALSQPALVEAANEALALQEPVSAGDKPLPDGDYILEDGAAWFTVGKFSVRIHETDEGVVVDVYTLDHESEDALASTYAFTAEAEEVIAGEEKEEKE